MDEPSSSNKKDADIQTQIVCGADKEAPESPTKDAGVQTQFTFDPTVSDSGIIPEIQTQDPKHSEDNIEVVGEEEEADSDAIPVTDQEANDETEEEAAPDTEDPDAEAPDEQNPDEGDDVQYQTADEGDDENHDFMTDEVDAADIEAESAEDEVTPGDQQTAEIETQTAMMLGVDSVGLMSPLKCMSAGVQTVFTYDVDSSLTNIKNELLTTHPRHSTDENDEAEAVADVDDSSGEEVATAEDAPPEEETSEASPIEEETAETAPIEEEAVEADPIEEESVEAAPDEDVDDTENEVEPIDQTVSSTEDEEENQKTTEIEAQTSLVLGVGSTAVLKGRTVGIQTVFAYDLDRSMTSIKNELLKTLPRHSTDAQDATKAVDVENAEALPEEDEASEEETPEPVPMEEETAEAAPSEEEEPVEAAPTEDESPEDAPTEEDTAEAASPEEDNIEASADEDVAEESGDQKGTEVEAQTSLVLGVGNTEVKEETQKTAEIEAQTSLVLGTGNILGQTVGIQTVFTYDLDRSMTSIKKELLRTIPRHSIDVKDDMKGVEDTSDVVENAEAPPEEEAASEEEPPVDVPNEEETVEAAPSEEETVEAAPSEEEAVESAPPEEETPEDAPTEEETVEVAPTEEEIIEASADEEVDDKSGDRKETEVEAQTSLVLGVGNTEIEEETQKTAEIEAQTSLVLGTGNVLGQTVGIQTVFTYELDRSMTSIKKELLLRQPRHSIDVKDDTKGVADVEDTSDDVETAEALPVEEAYSEEEPPIDVPNEEEIAEAAPSEEEAVEAAPPDEEAAVAAPSEEEADEAAPTEDETAETAPTEEENTEASPDEDVADESGDQKEIEVEAQTSLVLGVGNTEDEEENLQTTEIEAQTSLVLGIGSTGVLGRSVGIQTVFTYDLDRSMTSIKKELLRTLPRHSIDDQDATKAASLENAEAPPEEVVASEEDTLESAPTEEETPEAASTEEETAEASPSEEEAVEAARSEEEAVEAAPSEEEAVEAAPSEEEAVEAAPSEEEPVEAAPSEEEAVEAASSGEETDETATDGVGADSKTEIESGDQKKTEGEAQTAMVLGVSNTRDAAKNKKTEIEAQTSLILGVDSNCVILGQSVGIQTVFTYDLDRSETSIRNELLDKLPRHSIDVQDSTEAVADVNSTSEEVENGEVLPDEGETDNISPNEEAATAEDGPSEEETPAPEDAPVEEETPEDVPVEDEIPEDVPVEEETPEDAPIEEEAVDDAPDEEETVEASPGSGVNRQSVGIQTVFTYDLDRSMTSIKKELLKSLPRHSTDNPIPDEDGTTETVPDDVDTTEISPDVEGISTEEEDVGEAPLEDVDTEEDSPAETSSEINVDTEDTTVEGPGEMDIGVSAGTQTVFSYDLNTSMTNVKNELQKSHPKHSIELPPLEELPSMQEAGIQTAFTYGINDSDTEIRNELLTSLPQHSTEVLENETVAMNVDANETLDVTPEGSVSSGEDELETRSVDPTHSKASDWLPETDDVEDIVDDNVSSNYQTPLRESSHEIVDNAAGSPKLIKLRIQIDSGVGHKPINMEISIVPPRADRTYPLDGVSEASVKQAVSSVSDAIVEDEAFDSEVVNCKREAEAQTNMAFETCKNGSDLFDELPSPPNAEPALPDDQRELLESASTEQFEMIPMLETDLLVTPETVPTQYVSTQVPLSDENCASAEDVADMKNQYFSDKAMIEEALRSGDVTVESKKGPVLHGMQDIDYEHWGFPYAVNMRYEKTNSEFSTVSDLSGYPVHKEDARSHLDRLDQAPSVGSALMPTESEGGVSTKTRVIFQIQNAEGESKSFDGRPSNVRNQVAFQMKIPTEENSTGEKNQIRFVLQYGKHGDLVDDVAASPSLATTQFKTSTEEKKLIDNERSMHIATVELRESESGDLRPHVHYNEGEELKSKALLYGDSPLEISIPVSRERMSQSNIETANEGTLVHRMHLVVEQEGDDMVRESITILEGAAPVTINIPIGDGAMGIALTANIINEDVNYSEVKPVEPEVVKTKPVRCTVITNGVPGETFEQVMEPSGAPLFFFLPMAEGPVRARLAIVPRDPIPEPRPTRARNSRAIKGTAVTCQVVHDGVEGEELTKSLRPGGLPLHLDIPLNMGLTAKIMIPHEMQLENERQSDGDCCRDRAYETVADAVASYEEGIQPLQNILDEICDKLKALNVPEFKRIGEPPDQPYLDFAQSEVLSECSCSMLVQRSAVARSPSGRCQPPQREYSARNSRELDYPDCNCGTMSSTRMSPRLSPHNQCSNNVVETYSSGSPRSNHSPYGSRRSSINNGSGYEQNSQLGSRPHSATLSPLREGSCSILHSASKECEICGHRCPTPRSSPRDSYGSRQPSGALTPIRNRSCALEHSDSQECEHCCRVCAKNSISPLAQMYITLSQPRIPSSDHVSPRIGSQSHVSSSRAGSYEPNESRGRCEDFYDEYGLACRRRGTGAPTWMSGNRAPDSRCTVRGRCQTCGSSKIEMLPPPPQLSAGCGCAAIVPFETALVPIQKAVSPVSSRGSYQLPSVTETKCGCKGGKGD